MKGFSNGGDGDVIISREAIATIAGSVAIECFGIVGMASVSVKDGIVNLLRRDSIQKGIEVTVENGEISLGFHVIVAYGVSISAVAENLMENVRYKVEEYTGMKVRGIEVLVDGVRPID